MDGSDVLHCNICFAGYNSSNKRPFDLGCGHSFCEECIKSSPRSFRYCPECRARASNPHTNIALIRLLDAMDGTGQASAAPDANGSRQQQPQQQQQQQQQPRHQQPTSAFGPDGIFKMPGLGAEPVGTLGSLLNQVSAVIPAGASASASGGSTTEGQGSVTVLPGSLASHKANIAQLRTTMWTYLTPLLGMLYILSPLDLIPDFIPLVGWLDDALVLIYVVSSLHQVFQQCSNSNQGHGRPR